MSARRCALDCLLLWEKTSRFAEEILHEESLRHRLPPQDRALAMELLYGSIRNLDLLDALIEKLQRGKVQSDAWQLLRLGLAQLFVSGVAEHAAVNETVAIARPRERGLVNAILRNALRRREELETYLRSLPDARRLSHPEFLLRRWSERYGAATATAYAEWNNRTPDTYGRLNPLALDREALARLEAEIAASGLSLGPEHPGFFRVEGALPGEWIEAGLVYIQDPATAIACRLLDPKPGELVLDACAAPGGKAGILAALLGGSEGLHATDSSPSRLARARENFERLGLDGVRTDVFDWEKASPEEIDPGQRYDAILLDAPCSNTGVIRRRVDVRWRLSPEDFASQARTQARLVANLRRALKPGGRLVYSTCSVEREENEDLAAASGMEIGETARSLPWESGFDGAFAALLRP